MSKSALVSLFPEPSEAAPATQQQVDGRKILVADANPITHELLKLLLTQRGHKVDVVTDGKQALKALRGGNYDVALLDLHLPQTNAPEIASILGREAGKRPPPRLVAVAADLDELRSLGENGARFSGALSKPLDIYQVCQFIEEESPPVQADEPEPASEPYVVAPSFRTPGATAIEQLGSFLSWPNDFHPGRLSPRVMQASLGDPRFDGILIQAPVAVDDLIVLWTTKAVYALPIIDQTGTLKAAADIDASRLSAADTEQLDKLIHDFQERRARLHRDLLLSTDLGEQLLGRLYVSNRGLSPRYDPNSRFLVSYDIALNPGVIAREAESLCNEGLLKRQFYDRVHVCPNCDSVRLHAREECAHCRSPDLREEQYIHHFRCAYQGPETKFRRGDALVCPKCRHELTHFGFDYDRPGSMLVCGSCGKAASEPAVGFMCLDCGSHVDSESAATRDVFAYRLTEDGTAFAEHGRSLFGPARQALRFTDFPVELVVALNAAAKKYNEKKAHFVLVDIFYVNERVVMAEHGARAFATGRALFVENLRAALDPADLTFTGRAQDFALLPNVSIDEARTRFDDAKKRAERPLRYDLGVEFQLFGPEDFA